MADAVKYETKTVQAVRGTESRVIRKWSESGWEVVEQKQGRIRSDISLRRPRPKTPWGRIAVIGGVAAALIVVTAVLALLEGDDPSEAPTASVTSSEAVPAAAHTSEAESPATSSEVPSAITTENNEAFASVLEIRDYCSDEIATFAENSAGETIQFDGSIDAMNPHGSSSTRYDLLLSVGDFSETESSGGPVFQFRDQSMGDLNLTGSNVPDSIGVGDKLHVTAQVKEFVPGQCLLLLDPVETQIR